MLPEDESSYTTATAEGLVVATIDDTRCLPADGAFGGVSTLGNWLGERVPFETCYYQLWSDATFCWTKAWRGDTNGYITNVSRTTGTVVRGVTLMPKTSIPSTIPIPIGADRRVKASIQSFKIE